MAAHSQYQCVSQAGLLRQAHLMGGRYRECSKHICLHSSCFAVDGCGVGLTLRYPGTSGCVNFRTEGAEVSCSGDSSEKQLPDLRVPCCFSCKFCVRVILIRMSPLSTYPHSEQLSSQPLSCFPRSTFITLPNHVDPVLQKVYT